MGNGEDVQFKRDATVKNMKELFIKEAVTVRTPAPTLHTKQNQRKILNDLEDSSSSSSDDDDDKDSAAIAVQNVMQTPPRRLSTIKKGKSPKGPAGRTLWEEETHSSHSK